MNSRHTMVGMRCEWCDAPYITRADRVEQGLGRYCSKKCFDEYQRDVAKSIWGRKDLAKSYKVGKRYCARWYDENGNIRSTSYARWWWEMNIGEIPEGMVVMYKDNNPLNIDSRNLYLGTMKEMTDKGKKTLRADPVKWAGFLNKQSEKQSRLWKEGVYNGITKDGHWNWRGGVHKTHPKEFDDALKDFVKDRDNYQCQICSRNLYKSRLARVHHIDGDKDNNDQENLTLLCAPCHGKVHAKSKESPPIMALRSKLHWS